MINIYYNSFLILFVLITVYFSIISDNYKNIPLSLLSIILFYFILSDFSGLEKKKLLLTMLMFSIYGYLSEKYIIKKTNILQYDKTKYKTCPNFLPLIYAYWVVLIHFLLKLLDYILKKNNIILCI